MTVYTGTTGNDSITGSAGDDNIYGDAGNDTLNGGNGNDWLQGDTGINVLRGGAGYDTIILVANDATTRNTATGGADPDLYGLWYFAPDAQVQVITDFAAGAGGDVLDINGLIGTNATYAGGNPFDPALGFLRLLQDGADTLLQWDRDGAAGGGFSLQSFVRLKNVTVGSLTQANIDTQAAPGGGATAGLDLTDDANSHFVKGSVASDMMRGGAGNDTLWGFGGRDTLMGGSGADSISGGNNPAAVGNVPEAWDGGDDAVYWDSPAGIHVDLAAGRAYEDGYGFEDTLFGIEQVDGSGYADSIVGGAGNEVLIGWDGNDTLRGNGGGDVLDGGLGADLLAGGAGTGDMASYWSAAAGVTVDLNVATQAGGGEEAGDVLTGIENLGGSNTGGDALTGNGGANFFDGRGGNDSLRGNGGNDFMLGSEGKDTLYGGSGGDMLFGGTGNDRLGGGPGADKFVFDTALTINKDTILDFSHAQADKIVLDDDIFLKFTGKFAVAAGNLHVGAAAAEANDFLNYNPATGELTYDANGSGIGGAPKVFAVLGTVSHPATLVAADFQVIA